MTQTVVGLFDKSSDAQQAVQQLLSKGFTNSNVDLSSGSLSSENSLSGTTNVSSGSTDFKLDNHENESGIKKFFKNLFNDDETEANRFSNVASRSGAVVTVHASSAEEAHRAAEILDEYGAEDVNEPSENFDYSSTATDDATMGTNTAAMGIDKNYADATDVNKSIPIIEENLEVGKRTVQTGGLRLRSRIVERPVEESLRLREEYVRVDRNTVNRAATEADFAAFKEGEIEMIERAEVPVVSKQARVVEEVSLGKDINERSETIRDTVRETKVDVENIEGSTKTSTDRTSDLSYGN